ncbi:MAG: hypothetical protein AAB886_00645 [Patescibacteria group bacterium]
MKLQPLSVHQRRRISAVEEVLTMLVNTSRARKQEAVGGIRTFSDALDRCRNEDARRALRELSNSFALFAKKGFDPKLSDTADIGAVVRLLQRAGCELPEDMLGNRKGTGTPNAGIKEPPSPHRIPFEPKKVERKPQFAWSGLARRILADALENPPCMMIVGELRDRLRVAGNRAIGLGELVFRQLQAEKLVGAKATEPVDIATLRSFIADRERCERPILRRVDEFRTQS